MNGADREPLNVVEREPAKLGADDFRRLRSAERDLTRESRLDLVVAVVTGDNSSDTDSCVS